MDNNSKEASADNNKEDGAINQLINLLTTETKVDMEVSKVDGEETKVVSVIRALVQVLDIEQVFMIHRCTVQFLFHNFSKIFYYPGFFYLICNLRQQK